MQCVDVLIQAGAEVNSQSSWKISPLAIAMLKNHYGMVKHLLNFPGIDVNCKDEKGRTLISLSVELDGEEALEYIEYLLKEKGADPNIPDLKGNTPLHYLCAKYFFFAKLFREIIVQSYIPEEGRHLTLEEQNIKKIFLIDLRRNLVKLFIEYKANVSVLDSEGESLLQKCLIHKNYDLIGIIAEVAPIAITSKLINTFSTLIYNPEVKAVFDLILQKSKPTKEIMNEMDDSGFTPFLKYLKDFLTQAQQYRNKIYSYILLQLKKLKYEGDTEFSKESYKISYANYMCDSINTEANVGSYTL